MKEFFYNCLICCIVVFLSLISFEANADDSYLVNVNSVNVNSEELLSKRENKIQKHDDFKIIQSPFYLDLKIDIPVIAFSAALWGVTSFATAQLNPNHCMPSCSKSTVNFLDQYAIGYNSKTAAAASDIFIVALPVATSLLSLASYKKYGKLGIGQDLFFLAESIVLSSAINQIFKLAFSRPRPFMYLNDAANIKKNNGTDYRSFFSGHTTIAFAVTTTFAYVFSKRHSSSSIKWLIWTLAMASGVTVATLRVTSGKHFFSDVAVGGLVGTSLGVVVPKIHEYASTSVIVTPSFTGVKGSF